MSKGKSKQEREAQLRETQQELQQARIDLAIEKEHLERLIGDWNALITVLERELHIQVYSDGDLWTAEFGGKKSTGHQTIPDAFEAALRLRA